jgi:hypothetical protein
MCVSRLRDVGEELLATIAEVLLNELTFFKLLDSVGRTGQAVHASADSTCDEPCQPSGLVSASPAEDMVSLWYNHKISSIAFYH